MVGRTIPGAPLGGPCARGARPEGLKIVMPDNQKPGARRSRRPAPYAAHLAWGPAIVAASPVCSVSSVGVSFISQMFRVFRGKIPGKSVRNCSLKRFIAQHTWIVREFQRNSDSTTPKLHHSISIAQP